VGSTAKVAGRSDSRCLGKLSQGGEESQCGWLKDKYGLFMEIVPTVLTEMLKDKDPKKASE